MELIGLYTSPRAYGPVEVRAYITKYYDGPPVRLFWWCEIIKHAGIVSQAAYFSREDAIAGVRAALEAKHREEEAQGLPVSPIAWWDPALIPGREHIGRYTADDGIAVDLYLIHDGRSWGWQKTFTAPGDRPAVGTTARGRDGTSTRAEYIDAARRELISHALDQSRIIWGPAVEA